MKTKYILHGGAAQHPNKENDKFFEEILKGAPANPRILLVHFASDPEKQNKNIEKDTAQFERVRGDRNITYIEAQEELFSQQALDVDVIYFGGGTTVRLLDTMKKFNDLEKLFEGKTVAGESAGMNFLSAYCYSKSGGGVIKCLGIVPFKTIPHYSDEFREAKEELEKIPGDFKTLALSEYEYTVYGSDQ